MTVCDFRHQDMEYTVIYFLLLKKNVYFSRVCVCVCTCKYMDQQRPAVLDPLHLELWHLMYM